MSQHHTGGEEIRSLVSHLEICLLRTHVIGFARDDFAFVIDQKTARLRDSKVGELNIALKSDHDILKAYVAMDNAEGLAVFVRFGMCISQPTGHPADDEDRQFFGQYVTLVRQLLRELLEVHAPNQLHCNKINSARLPQMVRLDNV